MVADRIDYPGGRKANESLIWFLKEAQKMNYLDELISVDDEFINEI